MHKVMLAISFDLPLALFQLGQACRAQGKLAQAERAYAQALAVQERASPRWPELLRAGTEQWRVRVLNDYANLLSRAGRSAKAENMCRHAIALTECVAVPTASSDSPLAEEASLLELQTALLRDYARLLHRLGRRVEAAQFDARANAAEADAKAKRNAFEEHQEPDLEDGEGSSQEP